MENEICETCNGYETVMRKFHDGGSGTANESIPCPTCCPAPETRDGTACRPAPGCDLVEDVVMALIYNVDDGERMGIALRDYVADLRAQQVPGGSLTCSCGRNTTSQPQACWAKRVDVETVHDECSVCGDICILAIAAAGAARRGGTEIDSTRD